MDYAQEDILAGDFWNKLVSQKGFYGEIEKSAEVVCVPPKGSIESKGMTKAMYEKHVFKASPFFVGQYISLSGTIVMRLCEGYIYVSEADKADPFHTAKEYKVKIFTEELVYSAAYRSFRVLAVERRLDVFGLHLKAALSATHVSDSSAKYPLIASGEEGEKYLLQWPENGYILRKHKGQFVQFNESYVCVRGFEQHVVSKVDGMIESFLEALIIANQEFKAIYHSDESRISHLKRVVVGVVLNYVFDKIFDQVCVPCQTDQDSKFQVIVDGT